MAGVEGQEPGQEVDRVAVVDVPEDLVEGAYDSRERRVVVGEACTAHVLGEHVGAGGHDERLDARHRATSAHGRHEVPRLGARHSVQQRVVVGG